MSTPAVYVLEGSNGALRVSPPIFPNNKLGISPGDLTQFTPHGNGVYGFEGGRINPFKTAPQHDNVGGFLHFANSVRRKHFDVLMNIMGVRYASCDYAVFLQESENPGQDAYLSQMRIVSKFALRHMFGAFSEAEYEAFQNQTLSMAEALWGFMENERRKYGVHFGSPKLAGLFGGDGDFAQEELCFGIMTENHYYGVYRIWSRAWLVTK